MKFCTTMIMGVAAATACATGFAQDRISRAFTATGTSCSDVTWSREALALYPRIASACEEVMQRDGKYYVKFSGDVQRVADRGRSVTINFRDGDRLLLAPTENMSLFINGRRTPVTDLKVGDQLRFYVPQDQLAASFFESEAPTAQAQVVPIAPPAAAEPALLAQNQAAPGRAVAADGERIAARRYRGVGALGVGQRVDAPAPDRTLALSIPAPVSSQWRARCRICTRDEGVERCCYGESLLR